MRRKNTKKDEIGKTGGLMFLLSIPFLFFLGGCLLLSWISIFLTAGTKDGQLGIFLFALIGTQVIFSSMPQGRVRIFIHELKHALFIAVVGDKIKNFSVGKDGGYVEYNVDKKDLGYTPLIALAPYYFPLLSLPALILCIVFSDMYQARLSLLLGVALAFDLNMGIGEIHSGQQDFKKVIGGFLVAGSYIAGWIFFWINVCLLWIIGDNNGFIFCAKMVFYKLFAVFGG